MKKRRDKEGKGEEHEAQGRGKRRGGYKEQGEHGRDNESKEREVKGREWIKEGERSEEKGGGRKR